MVVVPVQPPEPVAASFDRALFSAQRINYSFNQASAPQAS